MDFDASALKDSLKQFLDALSNIAFSSLVDVAQPWPEKLSVRTWTGCLLCFRVALFAQHSSVFYNAMLNHGIFQSHLYRRFRM